LFFGIEFEFCEITINFTAMKITSIIGAAAIANMIVGRKDLDANQVLFDGGNEIIIRDSDSR
jgi:hypothetical protein